MDNFGTREELKKFIEEIVDERVGAIGQFDILPQTIKERHIDWEEFGVTLNSSIIQKISELIYVSDTATGSTSIGNGAIESVTVTVSDSSGDADRIIMAVIHVSAYETSVAAGNEIPWGTSLAAGDYYRNTNHDWGTNDNLKSTAVDAIYNESGGAETVLWRANARYIGQSAG